MCNFFQVVDCLLLPNSLTQYLALYPQLIPKTKDGSYEVRGCIERIDDTTISITELPIKKWTQDYKQFLEGMLTGEAKKVVGKKKTELKPEIKDFKENHTDTTVSFTIIADKEMIDEFEKEKNGLYGKFKLTGSISTTNMHLFDSEGKIVKYDAAENIMQSFFSIRLDYYSRRKDAIVKRLESEQMMLSNKARFVEEVCSGDLIVSNRKRQDILMDLKERGYDLIQKDAAKSKDNDDSETESEEPEEETSISDLAKGYEYLLGMKIWSLTYEKAEALRAELADKTQELEVLRGTPPSQLWLNDLDAIDAALDDRDEEIEKALVSEKAAQAKNRKYQAKAASKKKKAATKKKKKDEWDSEMETSDDEGPMAGDSDSDDDFFGGSKKPIAKKKPAKTAVAKPPAKRVQTTVAAPTAPIATVAKAAPAPAAKAPVAKEPVDELTMSLAERMKKKLMVSPAKLDVPVPALLTKSSKRPSPRDYSDDSDDGTPLKPLTNKRKTSRVQKAVTKKVTKKIPLYDSESEDEFNFADASDSEGEPVKKMAPARARRARATAAPTYSFDSDSDF